MVIAGIMLDSYNFYWMILVGLTLGITFLICFFMFLRDSKRISNIFLNVEILLHWTFDQIDRDKKAQEEFVERKKYNKRLLITIIIFFVVISGLFLIFGFDDIEEAGLFLIIMASSLGIITFAAISAPYFSLRNMNRSIPEVFIGPYDAWVMGEYIKWRKTFRDISIIQIDADRFLSVVYMVRQRYGYQETTSRIPIPVGREQEAEWVMAQIISANRVGAGI